MSCAKSYRAGYIQATRDTIQLVREIFPERTRMAEIALEQRYRGVLEMNIDDMKDLCEEVVDVLKKAVTWVDRADDAEAGLRDWEDTREKINEEIADAYAILDKLRGL